jgi:predicted nucleic acid-binding protein
MKAYFDTNVLVAALDRDHVHHRLSFGAYLRARHGALAGCLSAHGLAEFYSVVTRTPFAHPVTADDVVAAIEDSIVPYFELIVVTAEAHRTAIAVCARAGWKGGRIHDAVHVQAAVQAGCEVIYTYDVGHFRSVAGDWAGRIEEPPAL